MADIVNIPDMHTNLTEKNAKCNSLNMKIMVNF